MKKILTTIFLITAIWSFGQLPDYWVPTTGAANTYSCNITPAKASSKIFHVKFNVTNTGTSTLTISNGISTILNAIALRYWDGGAWSTLPSAHIDVNTVYKVSYNGTYLLLESFGGAGGSGETNTASNLGGGLANYDSKSGVDLRFNSFASSDFDLATNLLSIDATLKSNWNDAYTDRLKWDGGATGLTASTGRTSLGGTTVGQNIFTATNPSAVRWLKVIADNTVSFTDAGTTLSDIGGQPLDGDLNTISALTPSNDDFMQYKAGAWVNRTIAQVKTDLSLTGTNSGDQTSIVGISGTIAQFNTALSDGDFATGGGTATGTNTGDQTITLTGDVTGSGTGSFATTLATVNSNVGTFGSATQAPQLTVNGKGLITAVSNVTVTPAVGSITGLGTGVATWLATPSWTNFNSAITGTAPYWSLASGGTLTGANTITSTTIGGLNFSNTWTATADAQTAITEAGNLTSRTNVGGDFLYYKRMTPTLTSAATSATAQTMVALDLAPTFAGSNLDEQKEIALRVSSGYVVIGDTYASSSGAVGNMGGLYIRTMGGSGRLPFMIADYTSANRRFAIDDSGTILSGSNTNPVKFGTSIPTETGGTVSISASGRAGLITNVATAGVTNSVLELSYSSNNTVTSTSKQRVLGLGSNFAPTSGAATFYGIHNTPVINQTGTASGNIYGFVHEPTLTAVLGTHYAFLAASGLSGFGTLTPTAKLEVVGNGTTTGIAFDVQNSALTSRFRVLDNGQINFSGSAGTSGQFLKSNGTGAAPTWETLAGGGDLVSTNNLSDVANATTARNNILPSKTGNTLKVLRVNAGETDYELATISGGAHTIEEEGTPLTARTGLNFVGSGITATDDSGNDETDVTLDADLNTIAALSPSNDDFLQRKSGAWTNRTIAQVKTDLALERTITFVVNESPTISTGGKNYTRVIAPFTGTIVRWKLIADASATATVDVWKDAAAIPTNSNTITASAKPSLSAAQFNSSSTLTGWTTSVTEGDILIMETESASGCNYLSLTLVIQL
jgi:hypothetical protein